MRHADPGIGWDDDDYTVPPGGAWGFERTFAAVYVAATVGIGMVWLWAVTVPGIRFISGLASFVVLLGIASTWLLCAGITAWRITTERARRPAYYLYVVPTIGVGLVAATVLSIPLRVRFEFVRSDFDRYAREVLDAAEGIDPTTVHTSADPGFELMHPEVPESLGGFSLRNAEIVPEGLIIFDTEGSGFDDAGFAFLPRGRFPRGTPVLETPQFRSLGRGWYSFTSSW